MQSKNKSIVFDLDDTICYPNHTATNTYEKYVLAKPNNDIIDHMKTLKSLGYHITISSARRMLTHNGNIDKIIDDVGEITVNWLDTHKVPYDEIQFGKPYSSTWYVDDKAINLNQFYEWMKNEND